VIIVNNRLDAFSVFEVFTMFEAFNVFDCSSVQTFTRSGRERMNTSPPSPCETDTTNPPSRNVKNHIKNDLSKSYLGSAEN